MLLKMTSEKLSNKTIDHLEESFKLLKESVVKDYYFFKMNLQPNIRKNINRATIDFLLLFKNVNNGVTKSRSTIVSLLITTMYPQPASIAFLIP